MRAVFDRLGWVLAGVLGVLVVALMADVARGGPLDPPGAPASTRPLVEPRIPISQPQSFPIVISQPGSYYLTQHILGVAGQDGIRINGNNITLDLNGFTLRGVPGSGHGITTGLNFVVRVTIRNGRVTEWGGSGIRFPSTGLLRDGRIEDVATGQNSVHGMDIEGDNNVVSGCQSTFNSGIGVRIATSESAMEDCFANNNGLQGFYVGGQHNHVTRNRAMANGTAGGYTGFWIQGTKNVVDGNNAHSNPNYGFWFDGTDLLAHDNVASGNNPGAYNVTAACAACGIAPIEPLSSTNHPMANIWW